SSPGFTGATSHAPAAGPEAGRGRFDRRRGAPRAREDARARARSARAAAPGCVRARRCAGARPAALQRARPAGRAARGAHPVCPRTRAGRPGRRRPAGGTRAPAPAGQARLSRWRDRRRARARRHRPAKENDMRAKLLALSAGLLLLVLALGAGTAVAGLPDVQTVGQTASNDQTADATSGAAQVQPSNTNISVRVLSPGDDGDVTQTNSVSSDAAAGNANDTSQSAGQLLGGGTQTVGQAAGSTQAADALSGALQLGGLNANAPVDNLAPSGDGSVQQAGSADASAAAGNAASTDQSAEQRAAAPCGCDGSGTQTVGQAASNEQEAGAASLAKQVEPR